MKPTVLITNDDGIASRGLELLALRLAEAFDVVIVAPSKEWSTTSHSLTLMRPIEVHQTASNRYVVEGTPTDCVHLALKGLLNRKPDLVVSGINRGANMGEDVSYSGTVAAAMEACLCGAKSFAISSVDWMEPRFEAAAEFAVRLAPQLVRRRLPPRTFFNVNVPSVEAREVRGARWTKLGHRLYPLDVRAVHSSELPTGFGRNSSRYFSIGGVGLNFRDAPGTDFHAVKRRRVSVTPLHLDLTCYPVLARARKWKIA